MHSATIISDASVCFRTRAAGWAAWVKSDGRPALTLSGPIRSTVASSNEAEMLALANALHGAVKAGYVGRGCEVLLQSDSMWALGALRRNIPAIADRPHPEKGNPVRPHRKDKLPGPTREAASLIRGLIVTLGLVVAVRHVKGHVAGGSGRHWVNAQCDRAARRAMHEARDARRAPAAEVAHG